jgi:hypothetical protein
MGLPIEVFWPDWAAGLGNCSFLMGPNAWCTMGSEREKHVLGLEKTDTGNRSVPLSS